MRLSASFCVAIGLIHDANAQVKADGGGGQAQGFTPDKWLFEPNYGLPIVRRQLK